MSCDFFSMTYELKSGFMCSWKGGNIIQGHIWKLSKSQMSLITVGLDNWDADVTASLFSEAFHFKFKKCISWFSILSRGSVAPPGLITHNCFLKSPQSK